MKVKDLILYQISTDRHYKVGDKLEFGKEYNYQGQRVYGGVKLDKRKACEDVDNEDEKLKKTSTTGCWQKTSIMVSYICISMITGVFF